MKEYNLSIRRCFDLKLIGKLANQSSSDLNDHMPKRAVWWVARVNGKPVGFAGAELVDNFTSLFLCLSGVIPKYRGKGIQKKMIETRQRFASRHKCKSIITYTMLDNCASSNSLIKKGFKMYEPEYAWVGTEGICYWYKKLNN